MLKNLTVAIKSVYCDDSFWSVLLDKSNFRAGPFDGGCLTCAKAILRACGKGELVRIVETKRDKVVTHHYGVIIDDVIYDFDGGFSSPKAWVKHFSDVENLNVELLGYEAGYDSRVDIPYDLSVEKKIAKMLLREFI